MSRDKHQEQEPVSKPSDNKPKCDAQCCRNGRDWLRYQDSLTSYWNGPGTDTLLGAWNTLAIRIGMEAEKLEKRGLARWHDLSPGVREKLERWSPMAKQLWESDFSKHQAALVQVWIWRYVEETLLFFSNSTASPEGDVACASPVWEHVRTLTRDLQPVRNTENNSVEHVCRIQFNGWRRMTEHLVRVGLGLEEFATPAVLVAHCKKSLRQLLANGEAELPDLARDADWEAKGDGYDATDNISYGLKMILKAALKVQFCFHGLEATYTLRFTPIGSGQRWGFPFDDEGMKLYNPPELRSSRDGGGLPPVQLVCVPMLAVQERYDQGLGKVLIRKAPMTVVTPYVFAGGEAEKYTWGNCKKYVEERRARRRRVEAGLPPEEEVKSKGRVPKRGSRQSDRIKKLQQPKVEAQQEAARKLLDHQEEVARALMAKQEEEAKTLLDKQKKAAETLLAKQRKKAKELLAKQRAEAKKRMQQVFKY